jgi:hypothetical protein
MRQHWLFLLVLLFIPAMPVYGQLPADAVMLDQVKIPELQKSVDLCPVYLEPSNPQLQTWEYKGLTYRGSRPEARDKFFQDPDKFAKQAERQRFINNFMQAMSTVWCPVTDQITPGGMMQWKKLGLTFESCCAFCDENAKEDDFQKGLEDLKQRAAKTYELIGAKYTEGARSPVEGAIKKVKVE